MSQILGRDYWSRAAKDSDFGAVRTHWSKSDFDTRMDECICVEIKFKSDDVVLDYGCGPGYGCKLIAPVVSKYFGLDYSDEMLDLARRQNHFLNAVFVKGDGISIPFPDGFFDCIYCELVFQHIAREDTLKILAEMKRTMKPDARFVLQIPKMIYGADIGFTASELESIYPEWKISDTEYYLYAIGH